MIRSNGFIEYTGFTIEYEMTQDCNDSCSNNGYCFMGSCICAASEGGNSCNEGKEE